ncbi:MAG: gliding motility-associated C-terminal domain-containing protein [Saprospiraceae bacterium]|nr:gliding motility-associated C-terminal domain-containing protein [Saprospiraceae bacterium]MCF8252804.1 gliding motility-associated C-terminal domain-containing protein [Saprospiraceae bacterium]MCF8283237.1 gliding motility-associated C-terminal domain-containing protein [Bacteroidales bacterium]MCF8314357.1 gliding motility-associated C-terminal domain-containing protein [Saprospiraceae bacterium]MCF8443231.1 gliding motility-associated C-terminal domain-containing protein [Saprospiraceae 
MKKYITMLAFFAYLGGIEAQWVTTVAGVLETPGFNNGPALSARFFSPHGIAADTMGRIYIADRYNHTIRLLDTNTGMVSTLAGLAGTTGSTNGVGVEARFNEPWGLCATPSGTVFVADTKNNKIRKILPDGTVSTVAGTGNFGSTNGPALSSTFGNPTGIEVDAAGNIYVADHLTHIIRKITPNGTVSTLAGMAYIPGDTNGTGPSAQFWRPYGLTLDNQGNILVADEWNHKIRMVTPQGVVTTVAGIGIDDIVDGAAAGAAFNYPWDMTVDPVGNIYVADGYNYVIRKIGTDGIVSSLAGNPQTSGGVDGQGANASFSGATAVVWSEPSGTIFVGDAYNHLIRQITLDGTPTATLSLLNLTGTLSVCEGDPLSLRASPATYSNYKFFLDGNLAQDGSIVNFTVPVLAPGSHSINVQSEFGTNILNSNTINFTVVAMPQPTITAVGPLSFYEGDSVILIASGTGSFLWSNGESTQTITATTSGTYFVEVTQNGCTGISNELEVQVTPLPAQVLVTVNGGTTLCPGETTQLVSSASVGNQWLKDDWPIQDQTSQQLEVSESGTYRTQMTDPSTGITALSNEVAVTVAPAVNFDFSATPRQGGPGQVVQFNSTGADIPARFHWEFGDGTAPSELPSPAHTFTEIGIFSIELTASDSYGCEQKISKKDFIQISETPVTTIPGLFIPNAFTPNGDGENDNFRVRGFFGSGFNMSIFNQWGELLFQSSNPSIGWDGNRDGLPTHTGTYVYLVEMNTDKGTEQISGHVTLLR